MRAALEGGGGAEGEALRGFFAGSDGDLVLARAPGRLDVMGGIADYSGALVLELPMREAALVVAARARDHRVQVRSVRADGSGRASLWSVDGDDAAAAGAFSSYQGARQFFARDPEGAWAGYVAGGLAALAIDGRIAPGGVRLLVVSDVPEGKGLSSSAAVEVAALRALCALHDVDLTGPELARLAQRVENEIVGAPCGLMDQMTAACGEQGRLLTLLCQPATLLPPVALPPGLAVWGIDSGVRHAVGGADYGSVRVAAFMGYRIIAEAAGLPAEAAGSGRVAIHDHLWGGYLANVTPSSWAQRFEALVPERLEGGAFLDCWGGITDAVTRVDPTRSYAVRAATAHPILEHARVRTFAALLSSPAMDVPDLLGELMAQSHASYSACGLGSAATDELVAAVRAAGPGAGLYGAKITGGGSGGTVAVLGRADAGPAVEAVAAAHARESGRAARVFSGSSPGAMSSPVMRLKL